MAWYTVVSAQVVKEDDKSVVHFVLQVHLPDVRDFTPSPSNTRGWVVSRKLEDFHALHKELTMGLHSI